MINRNTPLALESIKLAIKQTIKERFNGKASAVYDYHIRFDDEETANFKTLRSNEAKTTLEDLASWVVYRSCDYLAFDVFKNGGQGITIKVIEA
jgi:hypothetical protein